MDITLVFKLPPEWPSAAPTVSFKPPVYHPNVSATNGDVCVDILNEKWSASIPLTGVVSCIMLLLEEPNCDSPLNTDAAREYTRDKASWRRCMLTKYNVDRATMCPSSKPKD